MSKRKRKMTEDTLAALCASEFEQGVDYLSTIRADRERGLNYYDQQPFGNEENGLSKFVSSDVRDTVEWIMPQLVDLFVGGDTPVAFAPENEDDVDAAEIESKYCQYIFLRQNKGVMTAITWFKDALLQKNGIVRAYWADKVSKEREEYKNKTGEEYVALSQDEEFEIEELTVILNDVEYSEEEYTGILKSLSRAAAMKCEQEARYEIVGQRTKKSSQIKIDNIAPENFVVQRDHNSIFLSEVGYCCEVIETTRSRLLEETDYDEEIINSLPADTDIMDVGQEKTNRFKKEGGSGIGRAKKDGDDSRDKIILYRHLIRADFNGDKIAELREVVTAGKSGEYVLENTEIDRIDYHAITPYANGYKFHGRSVADNLFDLQRAKSQLWRNMFDAAMYSAIPRKIVSGNVDVDALLSYVPGGIIQKDTAATVENEQTPFVAEAMFPLLDKLDVVRAERSGFSKDTMGLNPDALANSTNLVGMSILAQSQLLIKMIATTFAYSGFESLMLHIRELLMKYETQEKIFDLTGKILKANPRDWRNQRDTEIKVGIGYAGKNEMLTLYSSLYEKQAQMVEAQGGINGALVNPGGIYNTVRKICQTMGIKDAGTYFQDPEKYQAPPPQPTLAEVTLKAQIEKMNNETESSDADRALKLKEMEMDNKYKLAELTQHERLETKKLQSQERLAEKELLYKYGKDAKDRFAADQSQDKDIMANSLSETRMMKTEKEKPKAVPASPKKKTRKEK